MGRLMVVGAVAIMAAVGGLPIGCGGSSVSTRPGEQGLGGQGGVGTPGMGGEPAGGDGGQAPICVAGSVDPCVGEGDCVGTRECLEDGSGYGPCECPMTGMGGASGTGGTNGTGGATGGSGGTGGAEPTVGYGCARVSVPTSDITDFSGWDEGAWGDASCCLTGGTFTYQPSGADPLVLAVEEGILLVTGSVAAGDYAGFGFWFGPCTDASAYSGITFAIGGDGGGAQLMLQMQTSRNYPVDDANAKGECDGSWGDPCASNEVEVGMPVEDGVFRVTWGELTGGAPISPVDPTELLGIQWQLNCGDEPCDVAITLDDVAFY